MSLEDLLKLYLGIDLMDTSSDALIQLLISMAKDMIKSYCVIDTIPDTLNNAVLRLGAYLYNRRGKESLTQSVQGARTHFFNNDIPQDIIKMLPLPKVKVIG